MKTPNLSELRKDSEREARKLPAWARWGLIALTVYGLWLIIGFLVIPPVARAQIEKRLSAQLGRKVSLAKVRFNPLTLSVTLESFAINEPKEGVFVGWRRLYVNFDSFSLVKHEIGFQAIELDGFNGRIAVAKDGKFNFADIMEKLSGGPASSPAKAPGKPWPLHIGRLSVTQAQLDYSDAKHNETFSTRLGPTSFTLRDFHTGGAKQAPGEFSAITEAGEGMTWKGNLSLSPLKSSGEIKLSRIFLKKYSPYYSDMVRFDVLDGRIDLGLHYDFFVENQKPVFRLNEGKLSVKGLKIAKRASTTPVVALDQIDVLDVSATWPELLVDIGNISVNGGSVSIRRDASGIDLASVFAPVPGENTAAAPAAPPAKPAPTPKINLKEISVHGLSVDIDDLTTPRPARHQFSDISCDLRNFVLDAPETPMPFGFRANLAPDGEVHLAGTITLHPMKVDLGVELSRISVANFSPYVESAANLHITKGKLNTNLLVSVRLPQEGPAVITSQGDTSIEDFAAFDLTEKEELASWTALSIRGVDFATEPQKLLIADISWTEPSFHFEVAQDGTLNLSKLARRSDAPPPVGLPANSKTENVETAVMNIAVDRFGLEKASFDFTDKSLHPNAHIAVNQFSGQIEGLSSSSVARATVDLRGRIEGVTPFAVTGKINPLSADAYTDLKVSMKGMELVPVGPYVGKYAGYELTKGNLSLDLKCKVNRQKVDSENVVTIDQFTFGNATNSPDATKLPVRLAVSLLKDLSGKIIIDVPVQGNLNDPNFRVGKVVLRVLTNLLTKVATSPFTLIGSMFGSGQGEELAFQKFIPGEANPTSEDETKKLDVIAKALHERPALRLEILGGFDDADDVPVLKDRVLEDQMRNLLLIDRQFSDPSVTIDQIQLDPQQRIGMIRRLYYKAHPSEKPKSKTIVDNTPSGPVSGQRGNLGAFHRKQASIHSKAVPRSALPQESTVTNPDGSVDTTSKVIDVKPPSLDEMRERLHSEITIDDETLRRLASDRANAVRDYLVNHGQIEPERLNLVGLTGTQPAAKGAKVELHLK